MRWYTYTIAALVWTGLIGGALAMSLNVADEHQRALAVGQSRALFMQVTDSRSWNARYGGVYVPVDQHTRPNPYLAVPQRDIETTDGQRLTLINPATMTREMSEIGYERNGTRVHITSLNPIRPANAPDSWEEAALSRFETGEDEVAELVADDSAPVFRYMAPLVVEQSCMECHAQQGYKVGDIRGGISITSPASRLVALAMSQARTWTMAFGGVWVLGLAFLALVGRWMAYRERMFARLRELSLEDSLTSLKNRRGFKALAEQQIKVAKRMHSKALLLFVDIDDFKAINDRYGHHEGDAVLRCLSDVLQSTFRSSDVLGRYGGDEFVVLTLQHDGESVERTVERLRENLVGARLSHGLCYEIGVSVGVVEYDPAKPVGLEELLVSADRRMYHDKSNKRAHASSAESRETAT